MDANRPAGERDLNLAVGSNGVDVLAKLADHIGTGSNSELKATTARAPATL